MSQREAELQATVTQLQTEVTRLTDLVRDRAYRIINLTTDLRVATRRAEVAESDLPEALDRVKELECLLHVLMEDGKGPAGLLYADAWVRAELVLGTKGTTDVI